MAADYGCDSSALADTLRGGGLMACTQRLLTDAAGLPVGSMAYVMTGVKDW